MSKRFKTPNFKNPNPDKVKEFNESGQASVSAGDKIFGGTRQVENPVQKIPNEIDLNKFYRGKN